MEDLPLSNVYGLLEPGPVVLLTTADRDRANFMPMSWHTMMEFEPPLIGCVVSNANFSFKALKRRKECVIAIPGAPLAAKVVKAGNCSGEDVDKFSHVGLTATPARSVRPPLIAECIANFECRVVDTRLVNRYNFFILTAVRAWIDPAQREAKTIHHRGFGTFAVDGKIIRLQSDKP